MAKIIFWSICYETVIRIACQTNFGVFGPIVWDPHYNVYNAHICAEITFTLLFGLKDRRTLLNIYFMISLINNICCEFLLRSVKFDIPCLNFRCYNLLYTQFCRTNYPVADLLTRICRQFNYLPNFIDFSLNSCVIKRNIIVFLNLLLFIFLL